MAAVVICEFNLLQSEFDFLGYLIIFDMMVGDVAGQCNAMELLLKFWSIFPNHVNICDDV